MTPSQEAGFRLYGRRGEREMLDRVVADVRAGRRRVLVLRGEPGTGKTVLLDYLAGQAQGCRVVRMAGIEQEAELAFAGLHQLLAPILDRLERLPVPQREALRIAFGLSAGPAPDRFLVAMAVLTLLSDLSRERPLICVADDAQWLDQASAQALAFAARHLAAASAAVIFSVRQPACGRPLAGLPQFQLGGLEDADARALLSSVLIGPLDDGVRDRIIAEARGKPRALLEVTRGLTSGELAGGFGLPSIMPVPSWIEEDYRRQLALLPAMTQLLLLIAAAEPAGNPQLVWRAARHLGVQAMAADPAVAAGLAEFGPRVRFCHPQARAAIYRAATPQQRQSVHLALAETSGSDVGPDQRAWHRAHATSQPDEDVAAELIGTVGRARARGGLAAAAAFSERAAELTPEPACRARRALDAAEAKREAGALDAARRLLATAQGTALDELGRARAELLHAQLTVRPGDGRDGLPLLLDAARRLEPLDARLAREAYREAFCTALTAGRLDMADGVMQVAKAVRAAPPLPQPRAADLLLDGLAALVTDGHAVGAPMLRRAVRAFRDAAVPAAEALRWLPFACQLAGFAWDDESWHVLSARLIDLARQAGALAVFPDGLQDGTALWLATGETAAERASADPGELGLATRSLAELIEAAARTGAVEQASGALRRLSEATSVAGSDWALGIRARSTALLSGNEHAERLYLEAIERLGRTRIRAELARAHLLYGEWLRRQGRRLDAREQLRTAHQMLDAMGMEAFAERARKELAATGEAARKRTAETVNELTVQEAQIARLARDGHTNREISTKLFLSPRTVEWHLRKVFTKLGISSRRQLRTALPDLEQAPAAA
jgi:DNA-binding CsgD family transcriptional regulator